jgi:hypothetical protein
MGKLNASPHTTPDTLNLLGYYLEIKEQAFLEKNVLKNTI